MYGQKSRLFHHESRHIMHWREGASMSCKKGFEKYTNGNKGFFEQELQYL